MTTMMLKGAGGIFGKFGRRMYSSIAQNRKTVDEFSDYVSVLRRGPVVLVVPSKQPIYVDQQLNKCHHHQNFNNLVKSSSLGFSYYDLPDYDITQKWCVGSCHGYLAYISKIDCSFYFTNPLCASKRVVTLPPVYSLPEVMSFERDPDDGSIIEVVTRPTVPELPPVIRGPEQMARMYVFSLATSSSPSDPDCTVVAAYLGGYHLAFCKLNSTSPCTWTRMGEFGAYKHIAYFKQEGLFYTVQDGRSGLPYVVAWDLTDHHNPRELFKIRPRLESFVGELTSIPVTKSNADDDFYLVDTGEDLLLVQRYMEDLKDDGNGNLVPDESAVPQRCRTLSFSVFRVNSERKVYECMDSIGGKALFVGRNQAFALSTEDFPDLMPDSVYFTDDHDIMRFDDSEDHLVFPLGLSYGGHDSGVYNLRDSRLIPLVSCLPENKRIFPSPTWLESTPST